MNRYGRDANRYTGNGPDHDVPDVPDVPLPPGRGEATETWEHTPSSSDRSETTETSETSSETSNGFSDESVSVYATSSETILIQAKHRGEMFRMVFRMFG